MVVDKRLDAEKRAFLLAGVKNFTSSNKGWLIVKFSTAGAVIIERKRELIDSE